MNLFRSRVIVSYAAFLSALYIVLFNEYAVSYFWKPFLSWINKQFKVNWFDKNFFNTFFQEDFIFIALCTCVASSVLAIFILTCFRTPYRFLKIRRVEQMLKQLDHASFEEYVAYVFKYYFGKRTQRVGFGANVKKSKRDGSFGDGGKDVVMYSIIGRKEYVQCKFYTSTNPVGVATVRELIGVKEVNRAKTVYLVTTSYFTQDAIHCAKQVKGVVLIDGRELERMAKAISLC